MLASSDWSQYCNRRNFKFWSKERASTFHSFCRHPGITLTCCNAPPLSSQLRLPCLSRRILTVTAMPGRKGGVWNDLKMIWLWRKSGAWESDWPLDQNKAFSGTEPCTRPRAPLHCACLHYWASRSLDSSAFISALAALTVAQTVPPCF